jgi:hypothetical protein
MVDNKESSTEVLLAEFSALRNETLQRISLQWNIYAAQLAVGGVVFSFALTSPSRTGFLLIIPIIAYALFGQYMGNLRVIISIGTYIRKELSPRVPGGLGWEEWYLKRPSEGLHLRLLSPQPIVFPGVSLIALVWVVPYILFGKNISLIDRCALWVIWTVGLTATLAALYALAHLMSGWRPSNLMRELHNKS